jgi:uncharacterized protein (TIGR02452 family)
MRTKQIAQETVTALERGSYKTANGVERNIAPLVTACVQGTQCYDPDQLAAIREQVLSQPAPYPNTEFEVVNETTLQGCAQLSQQQYQRIGALNFASAKNPGGGFLGGAQAQEESLARSSGLYKSLLECRSYYDFHRAQETCLYSDRMIYSTDCPILRNDNGAWLDEPYLIDFITSPAPNAGAILKNEKHNLSRIEPVLRERSSKILALAVLNGCDALVLGAWGIQE